MPKRTAAGPHLVRLATAEAVLDCLRDDPGPLTATRLVELTGLTRATVIAVGEDLVRRGWATEPEPDTPARTTRGRPPRAFAFRPDAGCVVGLDMGAHRTTAIAADLLGTPLGTASTALPEGASGKARIDVVRRTALAALDDARERADRVLAVAAGVAAPVDRAGRITATGGFWRQFDVGLAEDLADRPGWRVILENDANLAALAEQWQGAARGIDDVAVLLAGERLGAGLIESGRLLRGRNGGAGELAFLQLVDGAVGPHGIAQLARQWGAEAAAELGGIGGAAPQEVTAEAVFAAAHDGDPVASGVLARLAERMARVVAVLSTIVNPELVVIGGAVAESAGVLLPGIRAALPGLTDTPARVEVSPLGGDAVALGAVRRALDDVAARALGIGLPAR